jgi:hypothetical protein
MQQGLDLIFAARLLADHGLAGSDQAAVFHRRPGRDMDPFDLAAAEAAGKLAVVASVALAAPLLVPGRDVGRVGNPACNPVCLELVMNPETAKAGFVDGRIPRPGEMAVQVLDQGLHLGGLGKSPMLEVLHENAHGPALLVHIHPDVYGLTREIDSVSVMHGKSPFGISFWSHKNYTAES